jgi:hypothetical protein
MTTGHIAAGQAQIISQAGATMASVHSHATNQNLTPLRTAFITFHLPAGPSAALHLV